MADKKVAFITGITGQDGSYLTKFLLYKDYIVHNIKCRTTLINNDRIDYLFKIQNIKILMFLCIMVVWHTHHHLMYAIQKIQKCKICGNKSLTTLMNFGLQSLQGTFPKNGMCTSNLALN